MEFGQERNVRDRVAFKLARYEMDEYTHPSKRSIAQKFEIQAKIAINKLIDMKLTDEESAERFLNDFIKPISNNSNTMNGGAFALVFCCCDWYKKPPTFIIKKKKNTFSWEEMINIVKNPQQVDKKYKLSMDSYIKEYGITENDLIRYLLFAQNYFQTK
jgi:hypothetical protein